MSSVEDMRDYGCFIPSFLDDFGLDAASFRLYAHISRRAGSGLCWESIDKMADVCRINRKTAYKAFKFLQDHKLILVEKRKGLTSLITLTNHSVWVPVPNQVQPTTPDKVAAPVPNQVQPYPKSGTTTCPKSGIGVIPNQVHPPVPNQVHKGTPYEGNPIKEKEAPLSFSESVSVIPDKVQPTEQPTPPEVSHSNQSSVSAAPVENISQQPRWRNRPNPDDFFMQAVPEWRVSHKRNDYQEWIMEYIRLKILPLVSQVKPMGDGGKYSSAQVISWLSNCEAKGDLGIGKIESHLEDAKTWWQTYSATKTQHPATTTITPDHVDRWLLAQVAKGDPVTVTNRLFDNPLDWTVMFDNSGFRAKLRDVFDLAALELASGG